MKQWEDIVKERLEGYESTLPEGSFAQFQKLRSEGKQAPRKKVYPFVWAAAAAVAASLAAVLFLRQLAQPVEEGVQLVQQQPVQVQLPLADSLTVEEPVVATPLLARAVSVKPVKPAAWPAVVQPESSAEPEENAQETPATELPAEPEEFTPETSVPEPEEERETPVTVREEPFLPTGSPFIPENRPTKRVNLKVAVPVAGGLLGTGTLALLAANPASRKEVEKYYSVNDSGPRPATSPGFPEELTTNNPNGGYSHQQPGNTLAGEDRLLETQYAFPLRLGVSARVPVWKSLYVTSGLEYSLYTSRFTYSFVGEKKQVAQYMGIPLRLDWVFPLGKRFDAYAGAGMQADFCLAATWDSEAIQRDKPILSLGAAGGVQLNLTQTVGLFVEPQLSWRIPTSNDVLLTYRTRYPCMFSLSAGVRINLEKDSVK